MKAANDTFESSFITEVLRESKAYNPVKFHSTQSVVILEEGPRNFTDCEFCEGGPIFLVTDRVLGNVRNMKRWYMEVVSLKDFTVGE